MVNGGKRGLTGTIRLLIHMLFYNWLFVFKIKGIFAKKSSTQKYAEMDSFLYIYNLDITYLCWHCICERCFYKLESLKSCLRYIVFLIRIYSNPTNRLKTLNNKKIDLKDQYMTLRRFLVDAPSSLKY